MIKPMLIRGQITVPVNLKGKTNASVVHMIPELKEHYLDGTYLILVFTNGSKMSVDISEYIGEITDDNIEAINNMTVSVENGELILNYDNEILNLDFSLENGNLIIEDNVENVDFNINESGELEAIY